VVSERAMNGVHDLGGMHGFGPVEREEDEPAFHAPWEATAFAIVQVTRALRLYNIDEFRHGIERMDPSHYLAASYYERWLVTAELNLIEKGLVSRAELDARTAYFRQNPDVRPPRGENAELKERVFAGRPRDWPPPSAEGAVRFEVGDAVVARNVHPPGHTRLPRYVRGKRGVIDRVHGVFTLPDAHAHGQGRQPQPVYSVCFAGEELWGDSAEPGQKLYIDLWESYLAAT
jgi:nitrile hydratase subunit beta